MYAIPYGIMTEAPIIREIRIDEVAGRGDSDSHMRSFKVIMPLKLQSPMKAVLKDALHCLGWQFMKTNVVFRQRINGGLEFIFLNVNTCN